MQAYYISLVCQVKHGLLGSCRIESPAPFIFPSHLHSFHPPSLSLFFVAFYLSHPCLPFSLLPCENILIWIHIQATRRSSHMYAARHSTELRFHRVHSYCAEMPIKWRSRKHQAIRRWAIITQTTPDHGERIWGAADMHKLKKKAGDELQGVLNYLKRGLEEDRNFCCLTRCRRLAAQRLDNSSGGALVQRAWHPPIDQWFHHTTLCKHKERTDRGVQGLFSKY